MSKINDDPFAPWNDPMYSDNPFVPHNDPMRSDNPFEPWNSPFGNERDLSDKDAKAYGIRRRHHNDEDTEREEREFL